MGLCVVYGRVRAACCLMPSVVLRAGALLKCIIGCRVLLAPLPVTFGIANLLHVACGLLYVFLQLVERLFTKRNQE